MCSAVSQDGLTEAAKLVSCILMFIGGSPAGTAGGVKTTTMAMLFLTGVSVVKGKGSTECFGRRIPLDNVRNGITIVLISFSALVTGVGLICVMEPGVDFMRILYEAASALGTVGLSADLTPKLCSASKIVLMCLMYIGRIGPITMAFAFAGRAKAGTQFRDLPEKRILIG